MPEGLRKGLVLKSIMYKEGKTSYIVILKKRLFFPGFYKTATLYKNWRDNFFKLEVDINEYDSRDYLRDIKEGNLEIPSKGEIEELKKDIDNLQEKTRKLIYRKVKVKKLKNILYNFEIQNVSKLGQSVIHNEDLEKKVI